MEPEDNLLRHPTYENHTSQTSITRSCSRYQPLSTFVLPKLKHYQQQYSDIYFIRLGKLKPAVERNAAEAWDELQIAGETVRRVERVLDVRQGELCWVVGTVYVDLPLKPNILDDISKDHWISAPPAREKYISSDGSHQRQIMLEDESGRLRLTGTAVESELLVTGCIIAVMGTENANGEFDVIDLKLPDLPRQPNRWERDDDPDATMVSNGSEAGRRPEGKRHRPNGPSGKVAIVSGLGISGDEADHVRLDVLMEYLLGEASGPIDQATSGQITRLIIAGNALADSSLLHARDEINNITNTTTTTNTANTTATTMTTKRSNRKYGYDSSAYNPAPTAHLDSFLATLLPTLPITLIPGASDPAHVSIPQQPIHLAMLPHSRAYSAISSSSTVPLPTTDDDGNDDDDGRRRRRRILPDDQVGWFDSTTNPWEGDIDGWRMLGTGGQPLDDIFKYVDGGGGDHDNHDGGDRLEMMERMLRWRCCAPTAPDTLWCYPFQDDEPFVLSDCPHVFFVGNQPKFGTLLLSHRSLYHHHHHHPDHSSSASSSSSSHNDDGDGNGIEDKDEGSAEGKGESGESTAKEKDNMIRLITIPSFKETGQVVVLDLDDLDVSVLDFDIVR